MEDIRFEIPEERFRIVEFRQEDLPGIMILNESLIDFKQKEVFAWHLSVMVHFENLIENGMPSRKECELIEPYREKLDSNFKGENQKKPNALFLARITWNKTQELIYRVYEPKIINVFLQQEIKYKFHPRLFDFRIDHDVEWL